MWGPAWCVEYRKNLGCVIHGSTVICLTCLMMMPRSQSHELHDAIHGITLLQGRKVTQKFIPKGWKISLGLRKPLIQSTSFKAILFTSTRQHNWFHQTQDCNSQPKFFLDMSVLTFLSHKLISNYLINQTTVQFFAN